MATSIGDYLKDIRQKKHLTLRQIEETTGIKNAHLSQLENGKIGKPSAEILHKLAGLFGVPYRMLMEMAGYPMEREEDLEIRSRIAKEFATLSGEEEGKLLEYLRFLRSQKE
jgi:transcriptional regulator with XRE-family HTH domain